MQTYPDTELKQTVRTIIAETLRLPVEEVTMTAAIGEELGAESLDFIDMHFRLEQQFMIRIEPGSLLDKLSEYFGAHALVEQGRLTELGAEVIRKRMPEIDSNRIYPGLYPAIEAMYTVETWVRVVRELLEARPQACTHCGSTGLQSLRQSVLGCRRCQAETACPTQADLLAVWAEETAKSLIHI